MVGFHDGRKLGVLLVETAIAVHVCGGFGRAEQRGYFFEAVGQVLQFGLDGWLHDGGDRVGKGLQAAERG